MLFLYLSMAGSSEDRCKVEQLYHEYRGLMHYVAKGILHDEYLAEDAVQQAFINIMKNIDAIKDFSCPQTKSFCVIISRRVALDMLRRERRDRLDGSDHLLDGIPDGTNLEEDVILSIDLEVIVEKISQLPDTYRDAFYLHYSNGCSLKQIAKALGISNEAAKKRLQRARKLLASMLEKEGVDRP